MVVEYDDFKKLDMRVGQIIDVVRVPDSKNLYSLTVDVGSSELVKIVSSLIPYYSEEELKGKRIIVLVNLKPAKIRGEISNGMLLAAETEDSSECVLIAPESLIPVGTKIL
ncbi:tRNA-binding protein [bacterium]|nr:tRNA-binding protein [bacterium]